MGAGEPAPFFHGKNKPDEEGPVLNKSRKTGAIPIHNRYFDASMLEGYLARAVWNSDGRGNNILSQQLGSRRITALTWEHNYAPSSDTLYRRLHEVDATNGALQGTVCTPNMNAVP